MIGGLLFVIPSIFLGILLIFYIPLILFENANLMNVFVKSAKLVWGNWWRTFGISLLFWIIPTVLLFVFASFDIRHTLFGLLIELLINSLAILLNAVALLLLYHDLQLRAHQTENTKTA